MIMIANELLSLSLIRLLTTSLDEVNVCDADMVLKKWNDVERDGVEDLPHWLFIHIYSNLKLITRNI